MSEHGADCIIEAGTVLCGAASDGTMALRHDVGIRIHNGVIAQIGPMPAVGYGNDHLPRYGSPKAVAMPGLVNGHHHFGITPLMNGVPFAPLELWLPRFRAMRHIGPRLDTLYSAIEMLESGTTCVHHIHSGLAGEVDEWEATTEAVLGAYRDVGMRAGFSFMMRDRNILGYEADADILASVPEPVRNWITPQLRPASVPTRDYMDFFNRMRRRWQAEQPDMVRMNLAPANLHWCSDESLQLIFETARAAGANVHMHLLEAERQASFARQRFGCSAVEHLDRLGCLGPELTLGHGNWMSASDIERIAACGCSICHNVSSGLRLGSGIAPINEMRRRGLRVALGIDQSNIADDRDMMLEMKLVWALHRETGLFNDTPDAVAVLRMASEHGAHTAGFGGTLGRLQPGQAADIVLLDRDRLERPFVSSRTPIADTVLHRGSKAAIDQVFVAGRLLVDGGKVIGIDREAILEEIREVLARPETETEAKAWDMVEALMPHLHARLADSGLGDSYRPYRYNAMLDR